MGNVSSVVRVLSELRKLLDPEIYTVRFNAGFRAKTSWLAEKKNFCFGI